MSDSTFETILAGQLRAYAEGGVRPIDRHAIALATLADGAGHRPVWRTSRMTRLALIAVAALMVAAVGAFLVGQRPPSNVEPSPSPTASSVASAAGFGAAQPADLAIRATWAAFAGALPSLQNGSGPVSLVIDSSGGRLSVDNFAPGAAFASATTEVAPGQLRFVLDLDGAGCTAGAEGRYRWTLSPDGGLLTLAKVSDECSTRSDALARTWARSLVGSTFRGAGIVDSMDPTFAVTLPDDAYQARKLDDFIEIGGSNGFSLVVWKNPQGFADSCSDKQVRAPYTPGAAGLVAYFRQNHEFVVSEATPLTVAGHDAIHLVTSRNFVNARCPTTDLYTLTPKACDCHFFFGDDSLYVVDVGSDTFLFEVSPAMTETATEMRIINTIRIPYDLPSQ